MRNDKQLSKFLSLVLRHQPETIGLKLDEFGWGDVAFILNKINDLSMERLETIVKEDNKQRYSFNEDKTKIRANQGHSVNVDLQLTPVKPPATLFHGTPYDNTTAILVNGLCKMQRQHVHLSADIETARTVTGRRRKKSAILQVAATKMFEEGYEFFCSENGVWLTNHVPAKFIQLTGYLEDVEPTNTREIQMQGRIFRRSNDEN